MEAFAWRPWGKERLWERKPEPQSLPPPSVGRRLRRVKRGMCFVPTKASQSFRLLFVSGTMLGTAFNKMWISDD